MLTTDAAPCPAYSEAPPIAASWFTPKRYRPGNVGNWSGHLAFAYDLVRTLKPSLLVELGTHWGESYFTFCQSVAENNVACACYAVDSWQGERQAGLYGEEVYADVSAYNQANYAPFSYLLRSTFDDASSRFSPDSIGLLHIDGMHTYEAVKRDFENWLPKVAPGGIIFLHDIMVRHGDFGVWKLWDEIKQRFPEATFEFHHHWGLGVVRKPGGRSTIPFLKALFNASADAAEDIRRYYFIYSSHLENTFRPPRDNSVLQAGLSINKGGEYADEDSTWKAIEPGDWRMLTFELPEGTGDGPLHFYPSTFPCRIELASVQLRAPDTNEILWRCEASDENRFETRGTLMRIAADPEPLIFSTGARPLFAFFVPSLARPLRFEARLRINTNYVDTCTTLGRLLQGRQTLSSDDGHSRQSLIGRVRALENTVKQRDEMLAGILHSLSWRLTAPIRRLSETIRGAR